MPMLVVDKVLTEDSSFVRTFLIYAEAMRARNVRLLVGGIDIRYKLIKKLISKMLLNKLGHRQIFVTLSAHSRIH